MSVEEFNSRLMSKLDNLADKIISGVCGVILFGLLLAILTGMI